MAILNNVKVNWASVHKPNTQFEPAWEVQAILTKEQAAELQAAAKKINPKGIKIKKDDDGTLSFRFKRAVTRKDGKGENEAPIVIDANKEPFTKLIGNGSVCNIKYAFIPWNNKFGNGVTTDFKGIQVVELVEFGDNEDFDVVSKDKPNEKDDAPFDDEDF